VSMVLFLLASDHACNDLAAHQRCTDSDAHTHVHTTLTCKHTRRVKLRDVEGLACLLVCLFACLLVNLLLIEGGLRIMNQQQTAKARQKRMLQI
jgi:hypothetical protein